MLDRDSAALMGPYGVETKSLNKAGRGSAKLEVPIWHLKFGSFVLLLVHCRTSTNVFHGIGCPRHRLKQHGQLAELMMAINEVRSSNHAAFDKLQRFANGPRCMMKLARA